MKFRKILSFILVVAVALSIAALASCSETENNNDNQPSASENVYTVTLVDNDGKPVSGAELLFHGKDDGSFNRAKTDEDGKAKAEVESEKVLVSIVSLPTGCVKPEPTVEGSYHASLENGKKEITLTIERTSSKTVTYTVNLVDQHGNAVEGATIQVCHGSTCESAKPTDENGKMTIDLVEGLALDVKVYTLPSGYEAPEEIDSNGYHARIEAGSTEITVSVTKTN